MVAATATPETSKLAATMTTLRRPLVVFVSDAIARSSFVNGLSHETNSQRSVYSTPQVSAKQTFRNFLVTH